MKARFFVIAPHFFYISSILGYAIIIMLSYTIQSGNGKEVYIFMEIIFSITVTVTAGVICHLICNWLDGKGRDN